MAEIKLKVLSAEQVAMLPQIREEWLKIGLSTAPVDRENVKEILRRMYAVAGKPAPRFTIFLDSPLQVAVAVALLRCGGIDLNNLNRAQVRDQVSAQVSAQVRAQVSAQVRAQVSDQVSAQVRAQVSAQVRDLLSWAMWYDFGQFDVWWLSWLDSFGRFGIDATKLQPMFDLSKSAGWTLCFWDWVFVSARPQVIARDERNRLHREDGPAVLYPDGFAVWSHHGVRVSEKIVMSPQSLTVAEIEAERNAEIRRVMIERFGMSRFIQDSGAKRIHHDRYGVLYRKNLPGDEPLVMVHLLNSTAESEGALSALEARAVFGSEAMFCHGGEMLPVADAPQHFRFKDYFLRVPPAMRRAKEAVAWTFGMAEEDYQPALET